MLKCFFRVKNVVSHLTFISNLYLDGLILEMSEIALKKRNDDILRRAHLEKTLTPISTIRVLGLEAENLKLSLESMNILLCNLCGFSIGWSHTQCSILFLNKYYKQFAKTKP